MGIYSIAEAEDRLSRLVKKAEDGEDVAHGVVANLRSALERAHRQPHGSPGPRGGRGSCLRIWAKAGGGDCAASLRSLYS
jgi:hypothetical protein